MTDLRSVSFADLLPPNLKHNPDALAAAQAIDRHVHTCAADTYKEIIFSNIDALDDTILNKLAYDLHIDYYDEALPMENRRMMVRSNLAVHMKKGTPWSIERALSDAFGSAKVEEWFEYEGEPYFFRVRIRTEVYLNRHNVKDIFKAIYQLKNVRSWLDILIISQECRAQVGIAAGASNYERARTVLPPPAPAKVAVNIGAVATDYQRVNAQIRGQEAGS